MNSSWNICLKEGTSKTSGTSPFNKDARGILPIQKVTLSVLSTFAFIGNTLVILVLVLDKNLLKKCYNKFILTLAIADVLTAISLIISVAVVPDEATNPVLGEIFCKVIWTRFLPYQQTVFSVYVCLGLSIERWFAVVKPQSYRDIFSGRRIIRYILASWAWSFTLCCPPLFGAGYSPSSHMCTFQVTLKESPMTRFLLGIFQVALMTFFPCFAMISLYIHMVVRVSGSAVASAASKAKLRGNMTRMVAVIYIVLIICWAPFQIFFLLVAACKQKLGSKAHVVVVMLVYVGSCVNPVIYGLSNKNYRQSYKKILFALRPRVFGRIGGVANRISFGKRGQRVEPSS